jgi:uncharacterized protein YggE
MRRGREYATAFGGTITGLVEASDTGLLATPQPQHMAFAAAAMSRAAGEEAPPEFDFEPARQTVSAQVEARFTMTSPSFGD